MVTGQEVGAVEPAGVRKGHDVLLTRGACRAAERLRACGVDEPVSDPELGQGVPLTRDGAVWRAGGNVPTQYRVGRCDLQDVPYTFTTTFTVSKSKVVDGVWTATRVRADHEVRAPQTATCVSVVVGWTVDGSGGG